MTHDQIRHFFATMDTEHKVHFFNEYCIDPYNAYPCILTPSNLLDAMSDRMDPIQLCRAIQSAGSNFDPDDDWAYYDEDSDELRSFQNHKPTDWLDDCCADNYESLDESSRLEFHEYLATH